MVAPSKMSSVDLAALGHAEELRHRPGGRVALQPGHRAGRQDQHAVRGLAAQRLLPGEGHHIELGPVERPGRRRRWWRRRSSMPSRSAAMKSAFGTRTPEVVPFQVNTRSASRAHLGQVRQLAVGRVEHLGVELQLLDDVGHPVLAEALEGQQLHRPRAQHRPHGHLHGAGVGAGHDADQVVVGDLQHLAGAVDGFLQARLAELGAVRAAEDGALQVFGGPAGALGAGAGRKFGASRPHGRLGEGRHSDVSHPCRWAAPRWEGVARRGAYTKPGRTPANLSSRIILGLLTRLRV